MTIQRLIIVINSHYRTNSKLGAIKEIKDALGNRTGEYLSLFECKKIVDEEWHRKGNLSPGRRIVNKLKEDGYVGEPIRKTARL